MAEDIAQFLQSTQQLMDWLDGMEEEMHKFDDPSTEPEELGRQSDDLAVCNKFFHIFKNFCFGKNSQTDPFEFLFRPPFRPWSPTSRIVANWSPRW